MRAVGLLLATLVGLSAPLAGANGADYGAPVSVVLHHDEATGATTLAWTPAVGARSYVLYAGNDTSTLQPIHHGTGTTYTDATPRVGGSTVYYRIVAIAYDGSEHAVTVVGQTAGDCVAVSTSLSFAVSIASCLSNLPEL